MYLFGFHRISGGWKRLQGPSDEDTLKSYQTYFERETLSDYYANTPHSGFAGDTRPVYSKFKISKKTPSTKLKNGVLDYFGLGPSHTTYKVDGEYGTYKRKVGRPSSRSTSKASANGESVESYRGYNIIHTRGEKGYFVPDLDDTGEGFRSKDDAKLFIAAKTSRGNKQRNPGMKIKGRKVYVSKAEVDKFFRGFPGSTKPNKALWFEFASNGDLVDIGPGSSERFDGYELSSLSQDAQKFLESKQKNPGKGNKSDGWIKVNAIRQLPSGDIQLALPKGTMSNPGKRKSFLKKVGKVFGKVVKTGKGMIGNPSTWGTSYFVSLGAAVRYYKAQGMTEKEVVDEVRDGSIHIGKPPLKKGQRLVTVDGGKRYAITEG